MKKSSFFIVILLLTFIILTPGALAQDNVYEVQGGDTLWDIAFRLYGNHLQWTHIWLANKKKGVIGKLQNGQPLIRPGDNLTIPKLRGVNDDIPWTDITYQFGDIVVTGFDYSEKGDYWLFGGYRWPPFSERPVDQDSFVKQFIKNKRIWYQPYQGQKNAVLYMYKEQKLISLDDLILKNTDNQVTSIFYDGSKFWVATGAERPMDGAKIFTFDGNSIIDRSHLLKLEKSAYISIIEGDENHLLFGGCTKGEGFNRRKLLIYYDGLKTYDMSNSIPEWRRGCIEEIKYNGEYWLIALDGQLYKFDGHTMEMEYISGRKELKKYLSPNWQDGIHGFDWDPIEERWLLVGWLGSSKGDKPISLLYNLDDRVVANMVTKFGELYPKTVKYTSFGWIIGTHRRNLLLFNEGAGITTSFVGHGGWSIKNVRCHARECFAGSGWPLHANVLLYFKPFFLDNDRTVIE